MNIPIDEKLIPQILTMLAQLCATGVIFIMYKKYMHEPVMKFLDARAEKMQSDLADAEVLKQESLELREKAKKEHESVVSGAKALELQMLEGAKKERQSIIDSAQDSINAQRKRLEDDFKQERQDLYSEVSSKMVGLAVDVNRKVLHDVNFDHDSMIKDIEKAMANHD